MAGREWRVGGLALVALFGPVARADQPIAAPQLRVGDEWVFDRTHEEGASGFSSRRIKLRLERLDDETMLVGLKPDGSRSAYEDHIVGSDWAGMRMIQGQSVVTGRPFKFPLVAGATWTVEWRDPAPRGGQSQTHWRETYEVVGWTDVTTPAGTFHAMEIRSSGAAEALLGTPLVAASAATAMSRGGERIARGRRAATRLVHKTLYGDFYYVPSVKYYVKSVQEQYNTENVRTDRDTDVLVSFKPAT